MFAKSLILLIGVVAVSANHIYSGVDPNTLSCDPAGLIHLLLPDHSDCNKFYTCAHGVEIEFRCPGNLIFDFEQQSCDWAWSGKCTLRTEEDLEGSGSGEEEFDLGLEPATNVVVESSKPEAARPVFTPILNCQSPSTAAQQLPYKGDCQRYWRCLNGAPETQYCSDGLYFNPQKQQCDFETNVKCDVEQHDELRSEFIYYN